MRENVPVQMVSPDRKRMGGGGCWHCRYLVGVHMAWT